MNAISTKPATAATTAANLGADVKPSGDAPKVKPCCVCKDEKMARDDCMLFARSDNPQQECQNLVSQYRSCMAGYGFNV
ncbi:cytochrome C oxidase copper chaperone-domain-containing protein [Lineolata rhizophorae]|uniref:Cytochrome C oxidase copper chaperone-domain-containing protein n=1 Tax=Lineolata rhizophorae TaxID=578093 RepID=A0A6A6P7V7_9PEZI|nr:cytochrome C oxidase copper chaperone-domain-containing protein [Lineolata rhizophorae]